MLQRKIRNESSGPGETARHNPWPKASATISLQVIVLDRVFIWIKCSADVVGGSYWCSRGSGHSISSWKKTIITAHINLSACLPWWSCRRFWQNAQNIETEIDYSAVAVFVYLLTTLERKAGIFFFAQKIDLLLGFRLGSLIPSHLSQAVWILYIHAF